MRNAVWACFVAGMLLMPFSSGAGAGSVVVAYGMPVLALASLGYLLILFATLRLERRLLNPALLAFMLVYAMAVGTIYAPEPVMSAARLVPNVVGFLLFLFLISDDPSSIDDQIGRIGAVYVLSAASIGGYYIVHFFSAAAQHGIISVLLDRVTGGVASLPWGATNAVGSCLIFPLLFSFALPIHGGKRLRSVYSIARLLMFVAIGLTLSIGVMIAVSTGLLWFAITADWAMRRRMLIGLVIAIGFVAVVNIVLQGTLSSIIDGATYRLRHNNLSTLDGRTGKYADFQRLIEGAPFLGSGYYSSLYVIGYSGHNFITTTLAERGLFGFALSAPILMVSAWRVLKGRVRALDERERQLFTCLVGAGGAAVLHLCVEDANFTQPYIIYSWVALALVFLASERQRIRRHERDLRPPLLPSNAN